VGNFQVYTDFCVDDGVRIKKRGKATLEGRAMEGEDVTRDIAEVVVWAHVFPQKD
jgi:hypothetical protein